MNPERQRYGLMLRDGTKGDLSYAKIAIMMNKVMIEVVEPFAEQHNCWYIGRIVELTEEEHLLLMLQLPPNLILETM